MSLNLQGGGSHGIGSEHASSSDGGHLFAALRLHTKKEIEVMMVRTIEQQIVPIIENLVRKIFKEEFESAQEKYFTSGNRSNAETVAASVERSLHLKFLDEVSTPVLTGQAIKGKEGTPLRVALIDNITGQIVKTEPESSAKVEIVVLEAHDGDNEHKRGLEWFNSRVIKEHDTEKPHFRRSNYIYLKEGIGELSKSKFAHADKWTKKCKCHLGAQVVENLNGLKVHNAWTEQFEVSDGRSNLYKKDCPPSLSDPVSRLKKIGRTGNRVKRLNDNNISTVQDFLFRHSVDPENLRQISGAGAKDWEITVKHAQDCIVDDKQASVYLSSSNHENGIVFDVVGGLKGIIRDSRCVPSDRLSEDEKVAARELLRSASENPKQIIHFRDEPALLLKYPYLDSHAATTEHTNHCEPGTSSPSNILGIMGQQDYSGWGNLSPNWLSDYRQWLETCEDNGNEMPEDPNLSGTLNVLESGELSNIRGILFVRGVAAVFRSMYRARKRIMVAEGQGDVHVSKRQRTCHVVID